MKKHLYQSFFALIIAVSTSLNCFAIVKFEKKIEAGSYSVCSRTLCLSDSGYLFTGISESSIGSSIACRLNNVGDTVWLKKIGVNDLSFDAVELNGSGYLIVGATQNNAADQSSGVWKVDLNGNLQWAKIITPDTLGYSVFTSIKKVGSNYLIGGFSDFLNILGAGGWANTLVMIDSSGSVIWSKMYWLDSEYYSVLSINLTSDNNILITGTADANYAMKIDLSGNVIWSKNYSDGSFTSAVEINGSYYFFGHDTNSDCLVTKTDANGIVVWTKAYLDLTEPFHICTNYSGGLSLAASMNTPNGTQACVLEIDTLGSPTKLTSFVSTSDDLGSDLKQTLDGGYIFSVQKDVGFNDAMAIIKTDSALHTGCEINNALPSTFILTLQETNFTTQVVSTFYSQSISLSVQSGGIVTSICNGSGLTDQNINNLTFYPTISSGQFHLSSDKSGVLSIYNSFGVKIKDMKIINELELDMSGVSKGIYLYKVIYDDKTSTSRKFIVN